MNEYGGNDASRPDDQTRPVPLPWQPTDVSPGQPQVQQPYPAPTWQWTGTPPPYGAPAGPGGPTGPGGYPPPAYLYPPPPQPRTGVSRRGKALGAVTALLLIGGAAAGGAAFGYAHGGGTDSASGFAQGGANPFSGQTGQAPRSGQNGFPQIIPPNNGSGQGGSPEQRLGRRPSRYTPPGHATASQMVGVVDINTTLKYQVARAAGTGMVVTSDGEVLTNNHVVEGATNISVTVVSTGKRYPARVVGTDKVDDVAVLQLTGASGLNTVTANTGTASVGDRVTAVGNAMGAGGVPSAAKGVITGINRSITTQSEGGVDGERLTGMIQVQAQVISGDSGGPLYDANGQVIGMDTAASSSPARSIGFAIPISRAISVAQQIVTGQGGPNIILGVPGFLGIQFAPGAAVNSHGGGAPVSGVVPRTPAANIGLVPGDTIISVSGQTITSGEQLRTVLSHYHGGDTVSVTWRDSQGRTHTANAKLIAGPAA